MIGIFLTFLRLGCLSFGGPVAHLGYFREEFVRRKSWLTEAQFAQCVAVSQLLPGPGSSQTGMLVGWIRGGLPGAVAAWIGFTLPSAVLMTLFARFAPLGLANAGWLHALLIVAVAVVASAILTMRRSLVTDAWRAFFAIVTFAAALTLPGPFTAPLSIAACAVVAVFAVRAQTQQTEPLPLRISNAAALVAFGVFLALLFGLPPLAAVLHDRLLLVAARLYAVGSLVFGGGHVVLPLLQTQVVGAGIASSQRLIAGYAAAQAIPGPLFTLSSYIGGVAYGGALGVIGSVVATVAIFFPSFLLLASIAPFYGTLSRNESFRRALAGANASVVGLLASAFVTPIWTNAIHTWIDGILAAIAFCLLTFLRLPAWIVVVFAAGAGAAIFR